MSDAIRIALERAQEWAAKFPLQGEAGRPDFQAAAEVYRDATAALSELSDRASLTSATEGERDAELKSARSALDAIIVEVINHSDSGQWFTKSDEDAGIKVCEWIKANFSRPTAGVGAESLLRKLDSFIDMNQPIEPGEWGFEDPSGINALFAEISEYLRARAESPSTKEKNELT